MSEYKAELLIPDEENQSFRNELATVTEEGKRRWIYPKKPSGRFYNGDKLIQKVTTSFLAPMKKKDK